MSVISEVLSCLFLVRASVGGVLVSLCTSLLGVSLVLKRCSIIGDGLSYVSFGTSSIVLAAGWSPLKMSIPVVVLVAFFLLRITENSRIKSDATAALVSVNALAIGIIITSLTTGLTTNMNSYIFGSILTMSREDVMLNTVLSLVVLILFAAYYDKTFAVMFDENFVKTTGADVSSYDVVIAILTAVTIMLGMRTMGVILISSLIIFPCLSSMRAFRSSGGVVVSPGIFSILCFLIGMTASYQFSAPAGASVMVANPLVFMLFMTWQSPDRLRAWENNMHGQLAVDISWNE